MCQLCLKPLTTISLRIRTRTTTSDVAGSSDTGGYHFGDVANAVMLLLTHPAIGSTREQAEIVIFLRTTTREPEQPKSTTSRHNVEETLVL